MAVGRKTEKHDTDQGFGRAIAKHAFEEAKKKKGGKEPAEPVTIDATVTITPGTWSICVNLGPISICKSFDRL